MIWIFGYEGRGDRFLLVYFSRLGNRFTVGIPTARCVGTLPVGCDRRQTLGWFPCWDGKKGWIRSHLGGMCSGFICFFHCSLFIYLFTYLCTHTLTFLSTYLQTLLIYPPVCLLTHVSLPIGKNIFQHIRNFPKPGRILCVFLQTKKLVFPSRLWQHNNIAILCFKGCLKRALSTHPWNPYIP